MSGYFGSVLARGARPRGKFCTFADRTDCRIPGPRPALQPVLVHLYLYVLEQINGSNRRGGRRTSEEMMRSFPPRRAARTREYTFAEGVC